MNSISLEIDIGDAQEVFELLCEIPYELPTMYDSEPPTERQHGIECMIDQLICILNEGDPYDI